MNLEKKKPELLMPAGDLETLKVAVIYGADAVYIGGDMYGLRAKAKNFSMEEMKEGIAFAHSYNKKVYVTANITAHNDDLEGLRKYFKELKDFGDDKPDALIITDPGVFTIAKEVVPEIDVHISTQANNTNYATFRFWYNLGATRVVAARELSLREIAQIRENIPTDMEIEAFIHGAMCIAYSGRCLLSNYFTGRDANLGECTHSCRWKYYIVEEKRPGMYLPIEENERGTYIFNSKDLCMIEYIPELIEAGVDSFKVEGRMKTALYVATIARTYRKAIDDYYTDPDLYEKNKPYYLEEVAKGVNRQFTTGFFFHKPNEEDHNFGTSSYIRKYEFVGIVMDYDEKNGHNIIEQRNKFSVGDRIEVLPPEGPFFEVDIDKMLDGEGNNIDSAPHPQMTVRLPSMPLPRYSILRKASKN